MGFQIEVSSCERGWGCRGGLEVLVKSGRQELWVCGRHVKRSDRILRDKR